MSPDLGAVWRTAYSPAVSRQIVDTIHGLTEWRDRLPKLQQLALATVWEGLTRELALQLVKRAGEKAATVPQRGVVRIALRGTPTSPRRS